MAQYVSGGELPRLQHTQMSRCELRTPFCYYDATVKSVDDDERNTGGSSVGLERQVRPVAVIEKQFPVNFNHY